MPIELRAGRKVFIQDLAIAAGEPGDTAIAGYEALLGLPACAAAGDAVEPNAVEFDLASAGTLRLSRTRRVSCEGSQVVLLNGPVAQVADANVGAAGGRIVASFSLEQGWTLCAQPGAGVLRRLVLDHVGYAWLLILGRPLSFTLSAVHVSDVEEAVQWYPRFLKIMGFGDATRIRRYGACIDIETQRWSIRLIPAMTWPLSASGIVPPQGWRGSAGELCVDPEQFAAVCAELRALGLEPRASSAASHLAVTDPFGYEWYLSG